MSFFCLHPRFVNLFQSSLKPYPGRDTVTLVLICIIQVYYIYRDRERLFLIVYFSILHPRFASLFYSSLKPEPGRDTVTLGPIRNSRWSNNHLIYFISFFNLTSCLSLCQLHMIPESEAQSFSVQSISYKNLCYVYSPRMWHFIELFE